MGYSFPLEKWSQLSPWGCGEFAGCGGETATGEEAQTSQVALAGGDEERLDSQEETNHKAPWMP